MCLVCRDVARELGPEVHEPYVRDLSHGVARRRVADEAPDPERPPTVLECGAAYFIVLHRLESVNRMPKGAHIAMPYESRPRFLYARQRAILKAAAGRKMSDAERQRSRLAVALVMRNRGEL